MLRPLAAGHLVPPVLRHSAAQGRRDLLRIPARDGGSGLLTRMGSGSAVPRRARAVLPVSMAQKRASSAAAAAAAAPAVQKPAKPQQKSGDQAPTFQEAVQRLQDYWASVGCAVWLPHNTEVGAGTMNPATFLRVLGPEPWNVCYAEPSIRPDDSRYGDNPNRVQRHTQFQVILKPEPGNPQELFLRSLEAIGIDTKAHDIRFVEDNWESPVLGAWGLGWEVWLDGMEITQFTYFQQAGSLPLKPVAVEITYGLERILMSLQGVSHFKDIRYNSVVTYGECFLQNEQEMSKYNLDVADVANQRQRFDLFDREAKAMLAARLPLPAYDNLLKTSQAFNMLDARGAVGVTERAELFSRMRLLAREVSKLWLERREEQGFPLLQSAWSAGAAGAEAPRAAGAAGAANAGPLPAAPETFLLEIGSEELPAQDVTSGAQQLTELLPPLLAKLRLAHGKVTVGATPRRLTAVVEALAPVQAERKERVRGPPAKAARGADGAWTKAAEGFAKKSGVDLSALTVEADDKGTEYVWAVVQEAGRPAAEVLAQELPGLVTAITYPRTMRWDSDAAYSRPLRWLVALHGGAPVRFSAAGVHSGTTTRVLRKDAQPERAVADVKSHLKTLEDCGIVTDMAARRAAIWKAAQDLARARGGRVPESAAGDLLEEVANLVEVPTPVDGGFDPDFLQLPKEVLVMVMRKHQRYFPVEDPATGKLLPFFVTVANGPVDPAVVRRGNEAVLRARYEDARFFYRQDTARRLEQFRPQLSGTVFEKRLGSLLEKSDRVEKLTGPLGAMLGLSAEDAGDAVEAARLACADLATSLVMEFTALAGVMGRHYAEREGIDPKVSLAIFESVLPRSAGDALPQSPAGVAVACADRVDSLVGLFAVGGAPTATTDPFGLRRAAYGLVETLVERGVRLDLRRAVDAAAALQPVKAEPAVCEDVLQFVTRRLEQLLVDRGTPVELVRSVLKERGLDPSHAAQSVKELSAESAAAGGRYARIIATYARPTRLVRGKAVPEADVVEALFAQTEETDLFDAVEEVEERLEKDSSVAAFFEASEVLVKPMEAFFEKVFVMAEDEKVRNNRLALMARVASLPDGILDLAELPGF